MFVHGDLESLDWSTEFHNEDIVPWIYNIGNAHNDDGI